MKIRAWLAGIRNAGNMLLLLDLLCDKVEQLELKQKNIIDPLLRERERLARSGATNAAGREEAKSEDGVPYRRRATD